MSVENKSVFKTNFGSLKDYTYQSKKTKKMQKTHYINGSSKEKYYYKRYVNILTRMKDLAKKLYFYHKLEKSKNNPKKTWNLLFTLLLSNTSFSTLSSLTVNNETFTNPTAIANQLNHHFVNIGKSLVTNLSGSNDNDCLTYLKSPCPSFIYFYPTTPFEIMNMISKLKINKANGHNDIMPFFLKISANIIAHPLSAIQINA